MRLAYRTLGHKSSISDITLTMPKPMSFWFLIEIQSQGCFHAVGLSVNSVPHSRIQTDRISQNLEFSPNIIKTLLIFFWPRQNSNVNLKKKKKKKPTVIRYCTWSGWDGVSFLQSLWCCFGLMTKIMLKIHQCEQTVSHFPFHND